METTKPLKKLIIEEIIFPEFLFEVSGKSSKSLGITVPKIIKEGTIWDFLNIHSVAKYQKIEGGPLETFKKLSEKKSHKTEITCTKNFDQGRDSNPRPSASQT